jgi:phenylalanine-4-hydroxylase
MGRYMAVVTSAFSGPADVNSFDLISHLPSKTIKAKHSAERDDLEILYQTVRNTRVTNDTNVISSILKISCQSSKRLVVS